MLSDTYHRRRVQKTGMGLQTKAFLALVAACFSSCVADDLSKDFKLATIAAREDQSISKDGCG